MAVAAEVEVIGIDDVDDAFERVIHSDVRYQFVIDTASFEAGRYVCDRVDATAESVPLRRTSFAVGEPGLD